jgi:hypothetical protein
VAADVVRLRLEETHKHYLVSENVTKATAAKNTKEWSMMPMRFPSFGLFGLR